ncbi:Protein of unknown function (DUF1644 [Striga hermonthica]|uniref:Uncharacterized protein n=1 Tax=Striga hermonthica TaxID=68872 RepID=A0A9N7NYB5_STRHE|nr:Protein of unknown function (DUF1644 [Striga hermonthica]
MAKSNKVQRQQRTNSLSVKKSSNKCKKVCKPLENKEWENAVCSVCLEAPHKAVVLLCSSHKNGCRPYMCATSHRFSNCLEQYTKAYANDDDDDDDDEREELPCPLCRGQVKGWTVVKPDRKFLNSRKRNCAHHDCSFSGTYKQMKRHVKSEHPLGRPRKVDPAQAEKWKELENERVTSDVQSMIRSTMFGSLLENGLGPSRLFGLANLNIGLDIGYFGLRARALLGR